MCSFFSFLAEYPIPNTGCLNLVLLDFNPHLLLVAVRSSVDWVPFFTLWSVLQILLVPFSLQVLAVFFLQCSSVSTLPRTWQQQLCSSVSVSFFSLLRGQKVHTSPYRNLTCVALFPLALGSPGCLEGSPHGCLWSSSPSAPIYCVSTLPVPPDAHGEAGCQSPEQWQLPDCQMRFFSHTVMTISTSLLIFYEILSVTSYLSDHWCFHWPPSSPPQCDCFSGVNLQPYSIFVLLFLGQSELPWFHYFYLLTLIWALDQNTVLTISLSCLDTFDSSNSLISFQLGLLPNISLSPLPPPFFFPLCPPLTHTCLYLTGSLLVH